VGPRGPLQRLLAGEVHVHCCSLSCGRSVRSVSWSDSPSARPRRQPRWKADITLRAVSGDRGAAAGAGGGAVGSRSCGARFCWRIRGGSPFSVSPNLEPDGGASLRSVATGDGGGSVSSLV